MRLFRSEQPAEGEVVRARATIERVTLETAGDDDRCRSPSDRGKNRRSESMSLHVHYLKVE